VEASWCLGVSRRATFRRVIVPLALPGIATGAILSFAHTMGEFGVVLMVGGNIAGVTRTVSISIYDQVQGLNYGAAAETSLVLLPSHLRCWRSPTRCSTGFGHYGQRAELPLP